MKQSIFNSRFFHPVKTIISFIAHSMSVAVMGVGLFMFGFYVIPAFGDTSLQLYASFNKPVVSASVITQGSKQLHQTPSKLSCVANCGDAQGGNSETKAAAAVGDVHKFAQRTY